MISIPPTWAPIVSLFVPVLVALAAKERADSNRVHALLGIALTALVATVGIFTDSEPQHTALEVVTAYLSSFVPMVASYLGFFKPVLAINSRLLPERGL